MGDRHLKSHGDRDTLAALAGIEIKALYLISDSGFWDDITVPAVITIVAMAPAVRAPYSTIGPSGTGRDRRHAFNLALFLAMFGLIVVVIEFLTV